MTTGPSPLYPDKTEGEWLWNQACPGTWWLCIWWNIDFSMRRV